jgi:hypothetical protein
VPRLLDPRDHVRPGDLTSFLKVSWRWRIEAVNLGKILGAGIG